MITRSDCKLGLFYLYARLFPTCIFRIDLHLIGYTGYVSSLDERAAIVMGTPTPSKLEVWLSREFVAVERRLRQDAFDRLVREST